MVYAKIASILYVVWGAIHVFAAWQVYKLAETLERGVVQGRVYQDAWNLLFFALFSIYVAIRFNWKNCWTGYWLNCVVVGVADIGFVILLIIPGHFPVFPGVIGPLLWLVAWVFSAIGLSQKSDAERLEK